MTTLLLTASILLAADAAQPSSVIVVLGAPGTSEYAKQFNQWADRWQEASQSGGATFLRLGTDESNSIADRERLKSLLAEQSKQSSEPLWLVFIGHGTFDGQAAKFNLRGPDISAATLGQWLKPFQRPLAVIECTSSSAPFINRLSGPNEHGCLLGKVTEYLTCQAHRSKGYGYRAAAYGGIGAHLLGYRECMLK